MKYNIRYWRLAAVISLILIMTSCRLPYKIVPNVPGESEFATTQPPPSNSTVNTLQPNTPSPGETDAPISHLPVAGSILRWVDLSDFVYVPAGEFIMGEDSMSTTDHSPARSVLLGSFWIQQAEVTNQQYAQCVAAGTCTAPARVAKTKYRYGVNTYENFPVVGVTWKQAEEYCTFIDARLPTEAEWEKTARGVEGKTYPWGNDKPACDLLNYNDCLEPSEPEQVRLYPNGASPFDAMDMAGNVAEWVADWYQGDYYRSAPSTNPPGPAEGIEKVYRGGAYSSPLADINPVSRFSAKPNEYAADLGFRCVLLGEAENIPIPPPACQVPALPPQPNSGPTLTPVALESAKLWGYCQWGGDGNKHVGVSGYATDYTCLTKRMTDFSIDIPGDPFGINCLGYDGIGCGGDKVECTSPHFIEGGTYQISYCYDVQPSDLYFIDETPVCAPGYAYNTGSGWCEPVSDWLPEPPCPDGYSEFLEYGCLPDFEGFNGCPVGFYTLDIGTSLVCIPMDECLQPGADESCAQPVCAQGQAYDPENECCVVPEKLTAHCPIGWYYDQDLQMCLLPDLLMKCTSSSVTIGYCPTLTPTPTINCSILNQTQCNSNPTICEWVPQPFGGDGYCRKK